ncbi:uncharacterized protein EAE97_008776 [Botrytis byssoidea]|uniref:Uncharacterized protein n=1 Tax=Botrytis byssoidea TaxID=139641 RepID=A0A9P5IBW2_9HELO|nr:uncharacterized protein EAE97_008776 [Botrytis byssoidea]KAF7933009.1 hypothetical protein EAE97_008776 [Botrytis byssoidea]
MTFILLFVVIILLSVVLTIGRGATAHAGGLCLETYNSQQPELAELGESHHSHESHNNMLWKDCGSSGEEAQAKGCVFDVILVAWLQPECFDSELHEAYLSDHDYPFWLDRSLQTPTDLAEVRLGKHTTVYSSSEFHLAHCAYFLEQSVRGFRRGGMVDNVTLDNEHTEHCARSLRDQWLPGIGFSPLHMDYHSCGMPRGFVESEA